MVARLEEKPNEREKEMDMKATALKKAHETDIDKYVRVIAKQDQGDGINFRTVWEECIILATSGAGQNGASVAKGNITLYKATDYGRHLVSFKFGPWVGRLMKDAEVLLREQEQKEREKQAMGATRLIKTFEEIDY